MIILSKGILHSKEIISHVNTCGSSSQNIHLFYGCRLLFPSFSFWVPLKAAILCGFQKYLNHFSKTIFDRITCLENIELYKTLNMWVGYTYNTIISGCVKHTNHSWSLIILILQQSLVMLLSYVRKSILFPFMTYSSDLMNVEES